MKDKQTIGIEIKWFYCGCYTLTAKGKKIYLKSNIDYGKEHPKHKPRCLYKETKA